MRDGSRSSVRIILFHPVLLGMWITILTTVTSGNVFPFPWHNCLWQAKEMSSPSEQEQISRDVFVMHQVKHGT
jgi:hypothetical protein